MRYGTRSLAPNTLDINTPSLVASARLILFSVLAYLFTSRVRANVDKWVNAKILGVRISRSGSRVEIFNEQDSD